MSQESDSLADERTWQQPLPGRKGDRPDNSPTQHESALEGHATTADGVTSSERTPPSGEVPPIPQSTSTVGGAAHGDPQQTQALPRDSSSEWDAMRPPVFEPGKVVFEKYRLIEKIGEGGMGEVWRVWHVNLEAERALKLIKSEFAYNDKGWKRFQREARLMAKINHPNAVAVYDFRRTQTVGYIEMEFICGRSLTEILKDRARPAHAAGLDDPGPRTNLRGASRGARPRGRDNRQAEADHPPRPQTIQPDGRRAQGRHGTAAAEGAGFRHRQDRRGRWLPRADGGGRPRRHSGLHEPGADPRRIRTGRRPPGDRWAQRPLLHRGGALSPPDRGLAVSRRQDGADWRPTSTTRRCR